MNCNDFEQSLNDFLDHELGAEQMAAMDVHQRSCAQCQRRVAQEQRLRAALRQLPVPEPAPGFFAGALHQVGQRRRLRRVQRIGLGLAAGLVLSVSVNTLFVHSQQSPGVSQQAVMSATLPVMQIALNEKRDVKLVFDTETEMDAAQLTLLLPSQVRLTGYPNQQKLSWVTRLKQGKNLLVLPVAARQFGHGKLIAEIEHNGTTKTFAIDLDVTDQQQSERTLTAAQTV